jgi:DNA-binding MarR family transcriptional regulator
MKDGLLPIACEKSRLVLSRSSFGKVINQMVALGLIEGRPDPIHPRTTIWLATPYGIKEGSRLVALKRTPAW